MPMTAFTAHDQAELDATVALLDRAAATEDAMVQACSAIAKAFGESRWHADRKMMARTAIRALSGDLWDTAADAMERRYRQLAEQLPDDLPAALVALKRRLYTEHGRLRARAMGNQYVRPSERNLRMLTEACIILRWLRRHAARTAYARALDQMMTPRALADSAEERQ
jgi:hypothetical protein